RIAGAGGQIDHALIGDRRSIYGKLTPGIDLEGVVGIVINRADLQVEDAADFPRVYGYKGGGSGGAVCDDGVGRAQRHAAGPVSRGGEVSDTGRGPGRCLGVIRNGRSQQEQGAQGSSSKTAGNGPTILSKFHKNYKMNSFTVMHFPFQNMPPLLWRPERMRQSIHRHAARSYKKPYLVV